MRGLNLSRLAARGRASESTYFKSEQVTQAKKLRSKLSPDELAIASTPPLESPSVDTLSEISAHSAYRKLVKHAPPPPALQKPNVLLNRLAHADDTKFLGRGLQRQSAVDPTLLKALGSSRLSLLQDVKGKGRALPGGEQYAEGAVMGIGAFGIATGIVAGVGLMGGVWIWNNPGVIDAMKEWSLGFRRGVDGVIGGKLRGFEGWMTKRGGLSEEVREKAGRIAGGVAGRRGEWQETNKMEGGEEVRKG